MSKANVTILRESPILVTITKKGRAVNFAAALGSLLKKFPDVPKDDWEFMYGDHKTRAYRKSQGYQPIT